MLSQFFGWTVPLILCPRNFELLQPKTRNISANIGELVTFQCAVDHYFKSCIFKHNKNNKKCEIEWSKLKNCEGRNFAMKRFNRWEITHKTNFFCELKVSPLEIILSMYPFCIIEIK